MTPQERKAKEVHDAKEKIVKHELLMAERRLKRLLSGSANADDFIAFIYESVTQTCGVEMGAPRDRGELALARFEGGRDVGIAIRDRCMKAQPDAWVRGVQIEIKRVKDRAEKFQKIDDKARRGEAPTTEGET